MREPLVPPSPQNAKCVRGAEETVPSEDADRSRSSPIFHAVTLGAPSACPGCSAGPTSPDCAGLWRRMSAFPVTPNCFFSPFSSCVSGLLPFLVPHLLPHSVCFVEMERAGGMFQIRHLVPEAAPDTQNALGTVSLYGLTGDSVKQVLS